MCSVSVMLADIKAINITVFITTGKFLLYKWQAAASDVM